jgi:hypothetical protein
MRWTARSNMATASRPRRYAVLAAHGGAGATTVLGLLALAYGGNDSPEVVELSPGSPLPVSAEPVLVTRGSAAGLGAAARVLATWNPSDAQPSRHFRRGTEFGSCPGRCDPSSPCRFYGRCERSTKSPELPAAPVTFLSTKSGPWRGSFMADSTTSRSFSNDHRAPWTTGSVQRQHFV